MNFRSRKLNSKRRGNSEYSWGSTRVQVAGGQTGPPAARNRKGPDLANRLLLQRCHRKRLDRGESERPGTSYTGTNNKGFSLLD